LSDQMNLASNHSINRILPISLQIFQFVKQLVATNIILLRSNA